MAHFAEIDDNNKVLRVIVADDQQWCENNLGGTWIQTSYNTRGGIHLLGKEPLRKNYAGIGYTYNADIDGFVPPQCHDEAVLNSNTGLWDCANDEHIWIGEITNG